MAEIYDCFIWIYLLRYTPLCCQCARIICLLIYPYKRAIFFKIATMINEWFTYNINYKISKTANKMNVTGFLLNFGMSLFLFSKEFSWFFLFHRCLLYINYIFLRYCIQLQKHTIETAPKLAFWDKIISRPLERINFQYMYIYTFRR